MPPYKSVACPYLENHVHFWSPYLKDITEIEWSREGQRKCVEPSESLSYKATLKRAGLLFSLERRRAGGNVAEAYKIMKGMDQAGLLLLVTFPCNKRKRENSKQNNKGPKSDSLEREQECDAWRGVEPVELSAAGRGEAKTACFNKLQLKLTFNTRVVASLAPQTRTEVRAVLTPHTGTKYSLAGVEDTFLLLVQRYTTGQQEGQERDCASPCCVQKWLLSKTGCCPTRIMQQFLSYCPLANCFIS